MNTKVSITLDVSKFNKSKIVERKYTNNAGVEVVEKNYKVDLVPLTNTRVIKETPNYRMIKTHFVCEQQTKEERGAKVPLVYVGDGITFDKPFQPLASTTTGASQANAPVDYPEEDINSDDIPF